ncbi:MAG: hypothetical protein ACLQMT_08470 [Candidatus Acidiferrales bacterium]
MDIKKCEFDYPVENRRSIGGIHPEMFKENVGFRFDVTIEATDPTDIEEMLKLFRKSASDFNDTWEAKLRAVRG